MKRKTFASYSFGCRVNHAELIALNKNLIESGYVYNENNPHYYFINSCAVTQKAEREIRQHIYSYHRTHPKTRILLLGCAGTLWKKNHVFSSLPVTIYDRSQKRELIKDFIKKNNSKLQTSHNKQSLDSIGQFLPSGRLLIKIQDGCHRYCTYCIVPYLRGRPSSLRINALVKTINEYSINTIFEIILTAINTEAFGLDTNEKLVDLITALIRKTTIPRISFGSIHPWSLNQSLIDIYHNDNDFRLTRFFHIPIQSGSNLILQLMKRNHTIQDTHLYIELLFKEYKHTFFSTDVIAGFIGETDKEFSETYTYLKFSRFSKFHVFPFSPRPGTASWFLKKRYFLPDDKTKKERAEILRKLSLKKYHTFCTQLINYKSYGLFLMKKKKNQQLGLLQNNIPVYIHVKKQIKGIHPVLVYDYEGNTLYGKMIT